MSLSIDGFWKAGFWSETFWADGFWFEGDSAPAGLTAKAFEGFRINPGRLMNPPRRVSVTPALVLPGNVGDYFSTPTTMGPEMITATNDRTFAGAGNWNIGVGVAVGSGAMNFVAVADGAGANLADTNTNPDIIPGQVYAAQYVISGYALGGVRPKIGITGTGITRAANITCQDIITAAGDTALYFEGQGAATSLSLDNISLKKPGVLDLYGSVSLYGHIASRDYTNGTQTIIAMSGAYSLIILADGLLRFGFRNAATNGFLNTFSTATLGSVGIIDGQSIYVFNSFEADDGGGNRVVKFYYSLDGIIWAQLGTTITTAGAIVQGVTGSLFAEVGSVNNGSAQVFSGRIYNAQIWRDLLTVDGSNHLVTSGATLVANPDASVVTPGSTSFVDSTGLTWTVNGNSRIG